MRVVYLLGEPAVGKSSVMREFISHLGTYDREVKVNLGLDGRHFNYARGFCYPDKKAIVMGLYSGEKNDGTDRLGLNTAPPMVRLLASLAAHPFYSDWTVFMEGDRCANPSFIRQSSQFVDFTFYLLMADSDVVRERHAQRGDKQSQTWLAGRATKLRNLVESLNPFVIQNCTSQDLNQAVRTLLAEL